jgi:hypothetical protein
MLAFDAPSREESCTDRTRSNIPQQALVMLNDPTYVEASRAFAARVLAEAGDDDARITWAWRRALQRRPDAKELATLRKVVTERRSAYRADPAAAKELLKVGLTPPPAQADPAELAALDARHPRDPEPARNPHPRLMLPPELQAALTRRAFLGRTAQGVGGLALASLLPAGAAAASGALTRFPFPRKAKRVIWLSMAGGPSHLETFDPKPKLAEMHGQAMPESFTKGQQTRPTPGPEAHLLRPAAYVRQVRPQASTEIC